MRDLRISVTIRCNFRCTYCMPREVFGHDFQFLRREQLLTFEEIVRLSRLAVGLGVEKIRITGGEPLLRRGVEDLVAMLAELRADGLSDLTLTTNGSLLRAKAPALRAAGLDRVTVSLDSLDDGVFQAMNDVRFPVAKVLDGIDAAAEAGFPVKVNMVVKRGANEHSILPMAERFRNTGHVLRFIEFMDVGTTNGWRLDDVVPAEEIISTIAAAWPLEPVAPNYPGEVASRRRYLGRGRRDRRHRLGDQALLRRLHACPAVGRGQPLPLPVRRARHRPAGAAALGRDRRRPGTSAGRAVAAA